MEQLKGMATTARETTMTVKSNTKNPKQYIFCAFDMQEKEWFDSNMLSTKEDALDDYHAAYGHTHLHGFFLEVVLPEVPEKRKELEEYPTFTV